MAAVVFSAQHDGEPPKLSLCGAGGSLGLGHPARPQTGHKACPRHISPPCCLQLPPHVPQDGVLGLSPPHIKHPALGSQGGIWELLSLQAAQPAQKREQWDGRLQTHLWQDPHWGHRASSHHGCEPGREHTPSPAPKRTSALFRSHSHHQHSPCSVVGMALATCFPHTPPPRTLPSVHEHLCAKVALKRSCLLQRGGGLCYHSRVTKPGGEKGGSASHPGLPQTAPEPGRLGCRV